jgi:hypothetical protein
MPKNSEISKMQRNKTLIQNKTSKGVYVRMNSKSKIQVLKNSRSKVMAGEAVS